MTNQETSISGLPSAKLSPQARWQAFSTQLPKFTRRQQWGGIFAIAATLLLFITFILPYVLPLTGPEPIDPHQLADPNGEFVEVSGTDLYFVHMAGDGDAVLLIHGLGGSTRTWQSTIPALHTAGFDVYAIDLPGMGLSEKGLDLDYSHLAIAEKIVEFMDSQGIERAHLVAHAFSGNVAAQIALTHPDRVQKLVLVAPTLFYEPTAEIPDFLFGLGFLQRWTQVMLQLVLPEAVGEQLRSATKIDEVVTEQLIEDYSRILHTADWDLSVMGMLRDSPQNALTEAIQNIKNDVLLLWGTGDGWAPPNGADSLLRDFPNAQLVQFEGIGHLPMHETPSDFNAALIDFLDNEH